MSRLLELEPVLVQPSPAEVRREGMPPSAPESAPSPAELRAAPDGRRADPLELDPVLVTPLRRPEPRRRQRRARSTARPVVIRAALAIVAVAALLSFAGRITAFALEPLHALWKVGRECQALEAELARQQAVNRALQADIAYLKTPAGVEQEARRLGYVRPGEVALTLVSPEASPAERSADAPEAPTAPAAPESVADRIRNAVDTCLAVFGSRPRQP